MAETLEQRVTAWLRDQGYPLEMETAWVGQSAGFDVSQSDYYIDPDDQRPREIDLVLTKQRIVTPFDVTYALFIECKISRDKPWLLFSAPNELVDALTGAPTLITHRLCWSFIANAFGESLISQCASAGTLENLYPRLDTASTLGYGVTQAFGSGGSVPFEALMSATKAACSYVERMGQVVFATPFLVAIPVVVRDVPLLSVQYSPQADLELKQIRRGLLLWKHVVAGRSGRGVYLVHREEMRAFLKDCRAGAEWWVNASKELLALAHGWAMCSEAVVEGADIWHRYEEGNANWWPIPTESWQVCFKSLT